MGSKVIRPPITVQELINRLMLVKDKNIKVAINCEISEDQDMPSKVEVLDKENCPYSKGDNVWLIYGLDPNEEVLFIR